MTGKGLICNQKGIYMKLLMYGAGSIGRGFIGPLFAQAGYEVVFADVNRVVIDALNTRRGYSCTIAGRSFNVGVTGVRCVDANDRQAVISEIASCDLMATALGAAVLQAVAPVISEGFAARIKASGEPLNILICENLKDAGALLRTWMENALPEEDRSCLTDKCGFVETAIGRMVPVAVNNPSDPLHITVEEYAFLPVDKDAFIGAPPVVEGLIPYSPFVFYEERKLYLHNMGHAVCAYLGMQYGHSTICGAIGDPCIRYLLQSAMVESASMLSEKHKVPFREVFDHAEDLILRFSNAALGDTCERVGRDPLRKLAAGDRLAGALQECRKYGVYPVYIALGYAAALKYVTTDPDEARKIALDTGCLSPDQAEIIIRLFRETGKPLAALMQTAEMVKKELRGNVV